mmetsp:Transcript_8768/g.17093  ORF Transcript_8768/g.17093 Transcript_8768/m.17093 type:complete len:417 (-) Transcript_8768:228-1478(-)|eukprot:CAMPEP_0167826176 /NCGR_PEP_ID=MMETSP0112_2-20121227/9857_1 /TAXON_ID=91324 /ORGANISM="Lotharella globosa, Strain CCCM811" /LENGTH=416 /DNA_ID=CAMNT_0007728527 /DNA_START=536 /DNA_END=1786 /DNA_ORIENTATION=-
MELEEAIDVAPVAQVGVEDALLGVLATEVRNLNRRLHLPGALHVLEPEHRVEPGRPILAAVSCEDLLHGLLPVDAAVVDPEVRAVAADERRREVEALQQLVLVLDHVARQPDLLGKVRDTLEGDVVVREHPLEAVEHARWEEGALVLELVDKRSVAQVPDHSGLSQLLPQGRVHNGFLVILGALVGPHALGRYHPELLRVEALAHAPPGRLAPLVQVVVAVPGEPQGERYLVLLDVVLHANAVQGRVGRHHAEQELLALRHQRLRVVEVVQVPPEDEPREGAHLDRDGVYHQPGAVALVLGHEPLPVHVAAVAVVVEVLLADVQHDARRVPREGQRVLDEQPYTHGRAIRQVAHHDRPLLVFRVVFGSGAYVIILCPPRTSRQQPTTIGELQVNRLCARHRNGRGGSGVTSAEQVG